MDEEESTVHVAQDAVCAALPSETPFHPSWIAELQAMVLYLCLLVEVLRRWRRLCHKERSISGIAMLLCYVFLLVTGILWLEWAPLLLPGACLLLVLKRRDENLQAAPLELLGREGDDESEEGLESPVPRNPSPLLQVRSSEDHDEAPAAQGMTALFETSGDAGLLSELAEPRRDEEPALGCIVEEVVDARQLLSGRRVGDTPISSFAYRTRGKVTTLGAASPNKPP
jgi:hypothetical protein